MKIKILGGGCPRCDSTIKNINHALDNLGLIETIEKIMDVDEIVKIGLTSTPAVLINDKIVFHGRIPTVAEIEDELRKEI